MRAAGSAVSMLLDKIGVICEYLKGVEEGKFSANNEIIRESNKVRSLLPVGFHLFCLTHVLVFTHSFDSSINELSLLLWIIFK